MRDLEMLVIKDGDKKDEGEVEIAFTGADLEPCITRNTHVPRRATSYAGKMREYAEKGSHSHAVQCNVQFCTTVRPLGKKYRMKNFCMAMPCNLARSCITSSATLPLF